MVSPRPQIEATLTRLKLSMPALVAFAFVCSPAYAVDWELLYRINESLRASDNIQIERDPEGLSGSSQTSVGMDIKTHTRTVDWGLSGDVGYLAYFGPDAPDPSTVLTLSGKSDLLKRTKHTDYAVSVFVTRTPASTSELEDLGVLGDLGDDPLGLNADRVVLDLERLNYGADTTVTHRVNKRNNLKFGTMISRTDFSQSSTGVTPTTFVEGNLDWTHRVTPLVDTHVIGSIGWQGAENAADTESLIYKLTFGTDAKLTKRLSLKANAGASIIEQTARNLAPLTGRRSETSVGFIGDISLFYQPLRDLTFEFSAQQTVAPDNLGDLRETRKFNSSTVYTINDDSSFVFDAALNLSAGTSGGSSDRETLSLSPKYVHRIVRHWDAVIGYQYIVTDFGPASRDSNTVFVTLSHSGTLRP